MTGKRLGGLATLFLILLSALPLGASAGEGSGGVSIRGGSGVVCGSNPDSTPVVLEDFVLGQPANLSFTIDSIVDLIRPYSPLLALQIKTEWYRIGPVESWPMITKIPFAAETLLNIRIDDIVQDFRLPDDCDIVQLAVMNRAFPTPKPVLFGIGRSLNARGRDLLRLHETIYAVADVLYGHRSSFLTRELMLAVFRIAKFPTGVKDAVARFENSTVDLNRIVAATPELYGLKTRSQVLFRTDFHASKSLWSTVSFVGGNTLLECLGEGEPGTGTERAVRCWAAWAVGWQTPENMTVVEPTAEVDLKVDNDVVFERKAYWRY